MKQIKANIISNEEAMPGVHLMWIECPDIAVDAKPGQFIMVSCGEGNLLRRPISIHQTSEDKNNFALLFAIVGKGTQWLSKRRVGSKLDILGPLGNGFGISPASRTLLMVGGGIGVAPLIFLAKAGIEKNCSVTLLLGAATASQLFPDNLIPNGVKCVFATDDGTAHAKGFITNLLPEYTSNIDQIFACGPAPMYRSMAKMRDLENRQVQISLESRMACGFGLCYGCTIKTKQGLKQVCKDGPVFNLKDIAWSDLKDL